MADMIKCKVNGQEVEVQQGSTVLEAVRKLGIEVPTLCHMKEINEIGACRICVVEVKGARTLVASCVFPASEGMEIFTGTPRVMKARRATLELILSNHRMECLTCLRNQNCELQKLARESGIDEVRYPCDATEPLIENSTLHLVRDNSKCILCRRCVAVCNQVQTVAVIGPNDRGYETHISCAFDRNLGEVACISCGQCTAVCPTAALTERDETDAVLAALADPTKHVVVGAAPSTRVTLGECFGMPIGSNVEGKMYAALRRMGFDKIFDVNVTADLTIAEEANEFVERVTNKGVLPMITSCSPGWVRFCEQHYPEFIPNLSSCKSPQQMFGAMMKTYYAEKNGIDPKDIVVVTLMPCTAKKYENHRDDTCAVEGLRDVDISLTTREVGRLIERLRIRFEALPDEKPDDFFSDYSGAGVIFGATGGVMEAALRTAVETITGSALPSVDFTHVRGTDGVKEKSYDVGDMQVRVAVASGTGNARRLLEAIKSGEAHYDFIEIMGCPGGCVNGGGQPVQPQSVRDEVDLKAVRAKALYEIDAGLPTRSSHKSPLIERVYKDFLEKPGSHKAHKILHTQYKASPKYPTGSGYTPTT